jgi:hypothetical protein
MDTIWKEFVWRQFGAAIDTLDNAIHTCPEDVWSDRTARHEYWYAVYHTLFFTDLYLSGSREGFVPPAPFTLDELDPAGILPERVYTKEEMASYLAHCREKCHATITSLTEEQMMRRCTFPWGEMEFGELLLSTMRHVQHHAAQLNMMLRQRRDIGSRWVFRAKGSPPVK